MNHEPSETWTTYGGLIAGPSSPVAPSETGRHGFAWSQKNHIFTFTHLADAIIKNDLQVRDKTSVQ